MSKHTPGPWTVQYETDIVGVENDPENECVGPVDVAHVYLRTVPGRTEANAGLIAAAPDVLGTLQEIVSAADGEGWKQLDASFRKARAAIAKATGKTE